jgi:hypothetical protein
LFLMTSANSGNKCTQCYKQLPYKTQSALLLITSVVFLYTLEMKVSLVVLNTSIKLVLVL